jgi:hypothetical protein
MVIAIQTHRTNILDFSKDIFPYYWHHSLPEGGLALQLIPDKHP